MNHIEVIGTTQVLKDAGVKPGQAEAIAKVVVARRDDLATKSDISSHRTEFKSDIAELKSDIGSLRTEFKSNIAELKLDIDSHRKLFENKINNLRWTMVVVGGVVVTLVKFLP